MKNVNHYLGDSFAFHKLVCDKKRNPATDDTYKNRLALMDINIRQLFDQYDIAFAANTLQGMAAHGYPMAQGTDLISLYKYKSATLQTLKTQVTTTATGRKVQCQNCTMNEVNTLDHLVPKEEFPEYAVNPKNLFPCCSRCNSYKGDNWRNAGLRTSLNLYIDQLPDIQYLFVNTQIGNNAIDTEFYLDNPGGVDANLFNLISSHYHEMFLLPRFAESADDVITSFKNVLESARNKLSLADTRELAKDAIAKDRLVYGHNYWQSVLKSSLIDDDDFLIDFD